MPTSLLTLTALLTVLPSAQPPASKTLLERMEPWRYPSADVGASTMQDGSTVHAAGDRTSVSLHCRTSFVTDDTAETVLAFYEKRLQSRPATGPDATGLAPAAGRAVHVIRSGGHRPVYTLNVFDASGTTTLLIIGGERTTIHWSQYERIDTNAQGR